MNKKQTKPVKPEHPLYSNVEPLVVEKHAELRIRPMTDFAFASGLNSILLTAAEFPAASQFYPIVFAKIDNEIMAFAVTGYKKGENIYVDRKGRWRENFYIPAFIRRYPFIFLENKQANNLALCVDKDCPFLSETEGQPLYKDGKPSEVTQKALEFAKSFHIEAQKTQQLCKLLDEKGLLVERNANFTLADGQKASVSGFWVIDEAKLNGLSDEDFLSLREHGFIGAIYCHLLSMRSWGSVLG